MTIDGCRCDAVGRAGPPQATVSAPATPVDPWMLMSLVPTAVLVAIAVWCLVRALVRDRRRDRAVRSEIQTAAREVRARQPDTDRQGHAE